MIVAIAAFVVSAALAAVFGVLYFKSKKIEPVQNNEAVEKQVSQPAQEEPQEETKEEPKAESEELANKDPNESTDGSDT